MLAVELYEENKDLLLLVGREIRRRRKEKKMTIKDMAKKSKLHINTIHLCETGQRGLSLSALNTILTKGLDTSLQTFFYKFIALEKKSKSKATRKKAEIKGTKSKPVGRPKKAETKGTKSKPVGRPKKAETKGTNSTHVGKVKKAEAKTLKGSIKNFFKKKGSVL